MTEFCDVRFLLIVRNKHHWCLADVFPWDFLRGVNIYATKFENEFRVFVLKFQHKFRVQTTSFCVKNSERNFV